MSRAKTNGEQMITMIIRNASSSAAELSTYRFDQDGNAIEPVIEKELRIYCEDDDAEEVSAYLRTLLGTK